MLRQAQLSLACIASILTAVNQIKLGQLLTGKLPETVRSDSTLVVSYINHQAVLQLHHLWKTGSPNPPVSPRKAAFSKSSFISHEHQNHRADILSRQGLLWEKFGQAEVPVCISRDNTLSDVVLPYSSSSSRTGCHGTAMAKV